MSDKDVLKEQEQENIRLKRYYNGVISENLEQIAKIMEEQGQYVEQMTTQNSELSTLMLTYHYELLAQEIGDLRTLNRKALKELNGLQ